MWFWNGTSVLQNAVLNAIATCRTCKAFWSFEGIGSDLRAKRCSMLIQVGLSMVALFLQAWNHSIFSVLCINISCNIHYIIDINMYIYMYVCVCVYIYMYVYICIYVYIYMCVYIYIYVCAVFSILVSTDVTKLFRQRFRKPCADENVASANSCLHIPLPRASALVILGDLLPRPRCGGCFLI